MTSHFLSCLFGSEPADLHIDSPLRFLIGLSGSELQARFTLRVLGFLSCLFGSEPRATDYGDFTRFLSCLFGSERLNTCSTGCASFLSCLFGSELDHKPCNCLSHNNFFCKKPCRPKKSGGT